MSVSFTWRYALPKLIKKKKKNIKVLVSELKSSFLKAVGVPVVDVFLPWQKVRDTATDGQFKSYTLLFFPSVFLSFFELFHTFSGT